MKELKIKNSELVALVDDEDYDRLSVYSWEVNIKSKRVSRKFSRKRKTIHISLAQEIMHQRAVMFDYKNRDSLNNQKYNLRQASYSQNMMNRDKYSGVSKYKGVTWFKRDSKWKAQININGKYIYLGLFKDESKAAKTYNNKAVELFKEFAVLNKDEFGNIL